MKILHSADWHLDSPFSGRTPEQQAILKAALRRVPGKVTELAKRENCDIMLLAGDLFDGPYTRESYETVYAALEDVRIPVFIAPGNHDFVAPGSVWEERWPGNVHIFRGDMDSVVIPELDCRVYGAGFRSMDCPGLLENFRAEGQERFCVAVLHGDATNPASPCNPMTQSQLRASGLDYVALGHIHKPGLFHAGGTICAWPGCPMGRGFDETGERGVYITELGGGRYDTRFVTLNTLRFHELEVDTGMDALSALETVLPGFGSKDFYRITLTGSGRGEEKQIREHFQHIPHLELRDNRRDAGELWAAAGEDSLEGDYFSRLRDALGEADPDTARQIELAARISRDLLDGREVKLP